MGIVDEYALEIGLSLQRTRKNDSSYKIAKDILMNLFAPEKQTDIDFIETLLQIDFPSIMSSFTLELFDEEPKDSKIENILKNLECEQISIDKNLIIESLETFGNYLCKLLLKKIS